MFIKVLLLVLFFGCMAAIGVYCRKHTRSVGDFVLGGRSVGPWLTAFAYGTSYFSAVVFIGYAGQFGWAYGVSATWIGIGNALIGSLLAWVVLGRRTRIMTKFLNASTMPEFFAKRYGSNALKIVASAIIFVFLVPYTASVYKGLGGLFSQAFGVDYLYCMIGMAVLTGIYVLLGGYMATAINDFIQGIIMLVGICCVVGAVLLNISTEDLRVRFMDVLPSLLPVGVGVLILGVFCSLLLARSLTRPLKEITAAVRDFSKGHLDRRVQLTCGGELQALGDEIDRMAFELSNMEESRKSFVANVSHELRSPLTSIRGYVQALRDGAIPEEEREKYMDVVLDETARLTALVRDLLDLSRIESGKFPMEMARIDLCEQMRRALLSFEGRIEEKRVEVAAELPETPCWVMADAGRIRQVIGNLIDNALKFLPEGGTLSVGVGSAGKRVYAYVEDNGPGIAKDDLPFIFDRFYKADKAHTAGMGTGLGLSIVKRILEQHGGGISVSSEPGRTVFRFELDAAPEEKKPALPPQ